MGLLYEIFDEEGHKVGEKKRSELHKIPFWHKTVILIVINSSGKIIFQKRPASN